MLRCLMLCSVLAAWTAAVAQTCANPWSVPALTALMKPSADPNVIYRACAIQGRELLPVLHELAKPEAYRFTAAGAAQVCLAKLGDKTALDQLKNELINQKYNENAIYKLARVASNDSIAILMDYIVRYQNDGSKRINMGDAVYDPNFVIMKQMEKVVPASPAIDLKRMGPSVQIQKWQEWWQQRRITGVFRPLEKHFPGDPYMQCLARKVEWGFPDALLDMDASDNRGALADFFRDLAGPGSAEASAFHTVRGNVQTILAKRGDKQEFEKIVAELNTTQYVDAIPKLLYIGNLNSVGVLIESMNLTNFLAGGKTLTKQIYDIEANRYLKFVFAALASMVKLPPVMAQAPPTKENIERWKEWWKKGQTAQSLSSARGTYE